MGPQPSPIHCAAATFGSNRYRNIRWYENQATGTVPYGEGHVEPQSRVACLHAGKSRQTNPLISRSTTVSPKRHSLLFQDSETWYLALACMLRPMSDILPSSYSCYGMSIICTLCLYQQHFLNPKQTEH